MITDIFKCKKREGPEGSFCPNCGRNHTVTEEFLKEIHKRNPHYSVAELKKMLKERMGAYNMIYTEHFLDYLAKGR